ncbi:MAG: hypothetical protein COB46_13495, partial [Rhodospirillaceae bacterium]
KTKGSTVATFYAATIRKSDRFCGVLLLRNLQISYQNLWKLRITELMDEDEGIYFDFFPSKAEKKDFFWYGKVSPKTVLLFPGILFVFFWTYTFLTSVFFPDFQADMENGWAILKFMIAMKLS